MPNYYSDKITPIICFFWLHFTLIPTSSADLTIFNTDLDGTAKVLFLDLVTDSLPRSLSIKQCATLKVLASARFSYPMQTLHSKPRGEAFIHLLPVKKP